MGIVEVTPPQTARAAKIAPEDLDAMASLIVSGKFAGSDEEYDTKGKASGAASRMRAALGERDDLDANDLRSRVWETAEGSGKFVFGVGEKGEARKRRKDAEQAETEPEPEPATGPEPETSSGRKGKGRRS